MRYTLSNQTQRYTTLLRKAYQTLEILNPNISPCRALNDGMIQTLVIKQPTLLNKSFNIQKLRHFCQ